MARQATRPRVTKLPPSFKSLERTVPDVDRHAVHIALEHAAQATIAGAEAVSRVPFADRMAARAKSAAALLALTWALPAIASLSGMAAVKGRLSRRHARRRRKRYDKDERPVALVLGAHMTTGLHLCRHLHAAGFWVIAADYPIWRMAAARASRAVDEFTTVPTPRLDPKGYVDAVCDLVRKNRVQLVVSSASPNHSLFDSIARPLMPKATRSLAVPAALAVQLDDKLRFTRLCERLGLAVPKAHPITDAADVFRLNAELAARGGGKRVVVKSIAHNPVARSAGLILPMDPKVLRIKLSQFLMSRNRPWVWQSMCDGAEYSCYVIANRGKLTAYADTEGAQSDPTQEDSVSAQMHAWVKSFCAQTHLDGQVSFDFMADSKRGKVLAIGCNPRASSVLTCFHSQARFAAALCDPDDVDDTVMPTKPHVGQYWLLHELYRGLRHRSLRDTMRTLRRGHDALLSSSDPWPFLAMHAWQVPTLLLRRLRDGTPWRGIDLNGGKLLEVGGDA